VSSLAAVHTGVLELCFTGVEGAKGRAKTLEKQQAPEMARLQALAQRMLG
jgi:hypothetical protein